MSTAQLTGRSSLRHIETTLSRQEHLKYHLGNRSVKKSTFSRANQTLTADFYQSLFGKLYTRCQQISPTHKFRFKRNLFSLDASLIDVSLKVFPNANYNKMMEAYKLYFVLEHDGLIPAFAAITVGKVGDQTAAKA